MVGPLLLLELNLSFPIRRICQPNIAIRKRRFSQDCRMHEICFLDNVQLVVFYTNLLMPEEYP